MTPKENLIRNLAIRLGEKILRSRQAAKTKHKTTKKGKKS